MMTVDVKTLQKQRAFEQEALPHSATLHRYALRITGNPDAANDLVQDTYLNAYRFFDHFERGSNCRAWLMTIMRNAYINTYRRTVREPEKVSYYQVEEFYSAIADEPVEGDSNYERAFVHSFGDEITAALEALPEYFRTVLVLCDIEGLSYEQIADMLHCRIGTVRSRLHRARKILSDKLCEYARKRGYV
jgi:RNA polymerase sigma-70 factor (ECF subfamily)